MTTKEQERAALVKIQKIINELGEDSYIATAFDGAIQLAEQNIDDDAAFSARWYIDEYHKQGENHRNHERQVSELQSNIDETQRRCDGQREEVNGLREQAARAENEQRNTAARAGTLEHENLVLKGRLYDLLLNDTAE